MISSVDTQIHALPRRTPHETPCVTIARAILHWQLNSKYQDDKDFYERQAARRRAVWQLEIFAAGTVNIFIRAGKKFYHRGWKRRARRAKAGRPNREGTSIARPSRYRNASHAASLKLRPYPRKGKRMRAMRFRAVTMCTSKIASRAGKCSRFLGTDRIAATALRNCSRMLPRDAALVPVRRSGRRDFTIVLLRGINQTE